MSATAVAGRRAWLPQERGDVARVAICAAVFLAGAATTVYLCAPMSGGMLMPGGWTLAMTWMRMPDESWGRAWAVFAGTWSTMMVAMMLPAVAPALLRQGRPAAAAGRAGAPLPMVLAGAGYFLVWAALGVGVYPVGALLADAAIGSASVARVVPLFGGAILVLAGLVQLSGWKANQLDHCRAESRRPSKATARPLAEDCCAPFAAEKPDRPAMAPWDAWWCGVRLGARCVVCCGGLMAALLALGAMDLRVMAAIGGAITAERLLPWPERVAHATGSVLLALGVIALARAVVPG